jgi:ribose transport system ATP-binding protein
VRELVGRTDGDRPEEHERNARHGRQHETDHPDDDEQHAGKQQEGGHVNPDVSLQVHHGALEWRRWRDSSPAHIGPNRQTGQRRLCYRTPCRGREHAPPAGSSNTMAGRARPPGADSTRVTDRPPLVEARGLTRRYPGVTALDAVDLEVRAGEVHVLLGENGAGKSTLVKLLSGIEPPDAGTLHIDGRPASPQSPREAQQMGISTIHQEFSLVPHLTVAENITLGHEPHRMGFVDRRRVGAVAEAALARLGAAIAPDARVSRLGVAEQQLVEIAKALAGEVRVLVMDEPTSALTDRETKELFRVVARLTGQGVGVVYISHRLEEIAEVGHRVTVLRDGRRVATVGVGEVGLPELVRMMADRDMADQFPTRHRAPGGELLRTRGLGQRGRLHAVDLTVREGEIVGVAGLLGAGRSRLARMLAGVEPVDSGHISVGGRDVRFRSPADAIRHGIVLLPEDRKRQGLVLGQTVGANLALPNLPRLGRWGFVRSAAEQALASQWIATLRVRTTGPHQTARELSGGNQQKVVLGKWLAHGSRVLIVDEPTRGIDVHARYEIYTLLNGLAEEGLGVLMVSSDLPEVLGLSDRVMVMARGRVTGHFARDEATADRVLQAALGWPA